MQKEWKAIKERRQLLNTLHTILKAWYVLGPLLLVLVGAAAYFVRDYYHMRSRLAQHDTLLKTTNKNAQGG